MSEIKDTEEIFEKESQMMTIDELAADPLLLEWLSKQPEFVETCAHAKAVAAANPWITPK